MASEQHRSLPDGFRHLPKVPRTGRATEILPRVLLTTRPDTLKAKSKRKPPASQPLCSKALHAKRTCGCPDTERAPA
eukprot:Skav200773  [mRNA]  locus=scaffold2001:438003:445097:+ [translate_table: standard]